MSSVGISSAQNNTHARTLCISLQNVIIIIIISGVMIINDQPVQPTASLGNQNITNRLTNMNYTYMPIMALFT